MIMTKIKQLFSFYRVMAFVALVLLIVLRQGSGLLSAQAVTQGYGADTILQRGIIVRVNESDATKIEPVSIETSDKIHGVVVAANDAPVTLSSEDQKVFVATTGKYDVLVSNQNGPIHAGDFITLSSIEGIGMRVDDIQPYVVGKALADFDGQNDIVSSTMVGDKNVNIGRVQADIQFARNPLQKPVSNLPDFLRRTAENIAGKQVNTPRIYLSLIIFFISTSVAASLLYGAVRAGIISVGRNPLSKKSIVRGMMQVVIVGLTIFISGVFGVYLLLRL